MSEFHDKDELFSRLPFWPLLLDQELLQPMPHASLAALSDENGLSASGSIIQIEGSGHGNRLVYFLLKFYNRTLIVSFNFAIPLYQTMFLVIGFMLIGLSEDISL